MISIVFCCHSVKLYAIASWAFRSQQYKTICEWTVLADSNFNHRTNQHW